jgi:hypothetical protein
MIFADMGVNPTPWGFSAYHHIDANLNDRAPGISAVSQ